MAVAPTVLPPVGGERPSTRPGVLLGLDEAGRGSVLGPLVVGGFLLEEERLGELPALGVKDSKQLTPGARERIYGRLRSLGTCSSVTLSAPEVDRWVRRGGLNELEARAFAQLIRRHRPEVAFADACDPVAARFQENIYRLSGSKSRVDARHHADEELPIVGAASIVAKVRRDRAIAGLQARVSGVIGSGYPSDATTVAYVRSCLSTGAALPDWVRSSWSTTRRLKLERSARPLETFDGDRGDAGVARRPVQPARRR
ncbi:MAG: ribonuclease HII [Thermoplasmata archaeon]|nr:ribonuclease HII [Thermoplasmata archaeon]